MKKPDRVEAGQWWLTGDIPYRVVSVEVSPSGFTDMGGPIVASSDGVFVNAHTMWTSAVLAAYEYLGSGENPEPSEWMIETLATLSARMIEEKRGGDPPGSFYLNADEEQRESVRGTIRWYLDDKSVDHWAYPNEARVAKAGIREVYRVLRSLGKW